MSIKPPMPYFGGKQRIAKQIVAHFPEHSHYVEPFAGGLSVFLAKEPSKIETLNDLDGDLVTFWRVLRDQPDELIRVCAFTPHSRAELALSRKSFEGLSDLEVARRVWVQLAQGRSGGRNTGIRLYLDADATSSPMACYLAAYVGRMPAAAARLADAQLECRDALDVIADYGRIESTLLYVDPPYLSEVRAGGRYVHEMEDADQHVALAEALQACKARVVLSGYQSPLYDELYHGWRRAHIAASTQQSNGRGDMKRTEVLWMNFEAQPNLFSDEAAS